MVRSTFAGFNMAALAIGASQRAIDVTGQNLSNINTTGYTRQRLDQISLNPVASGIASSSYDAKVGQGVMMTGVSQIRDPFLDIQYRNQLTKVGTADAEDAILAQIGQIFDETDKDAIAYQFQQIISQLQNLADPENTGTNSADSIVRSACEILLNTVHQNGSKIREVYNELKTKMDETIVPEINGYLRDIAELNKAIRNTQILGNPALELQDDRNELIDALATYFPIEVSYEKQELGGGESVDILNIDLKLSDGTKITKINLVHNDQYGEVGITKNEKGDIVEPVDFYVKESGDNAKTYGGGFEHLETALSEEMNGYISDIVNLNNDIKKYIDKLADVEKNINDESKVVQGYLDRVAELNNLIYEEKQKEKQDKFEISKLEEQRASVMSKLRAYFPNKSLETKIDDTTGMMSVAVKTDSGILSLIPAQRGDNGKTGSVSLKVDKDTNKVMMDITDASDNTATASIKAGNALYDLQTQYQNLANSRKKAENERDEKVKGLSHYFPKVDIVTQINSDTGYMSLTAEKKDSPTPGETQTFTLINSNNDPSQIAVESNKDAAGTVTATVSVGGAELGDIPKEDIDRILDVIGDKLSEGVIKGDLDMLNKAEIFDKYTDPADSAKSTDATDTKGIQYYQKMLDTFIDQFAKTMNELNRTPETRQVTQIAYDENGNVRMDPNDPTKEWEIPVTDIVYETEQVPKTDGYGKSVTDVNGNPVMKTVYKYEMEQKKDDDGNLVVDDDGNPVMQAVVEPQTRQATTADGKPIFDKDGKPVMETVKDADGNPVMIPKKIPVMVNGVAKTEPRTETVAGSIENPLFSTSDGSERFTAANIKISDGWMNGKVQIQTAKKEINGENGNSSDNWNVERMIDALSSNVFEFKSLDGDTVFKGTLYECYTNIQGTQAIERKATSQILDTHTKVLDQIADDKDSVSGVWMDEEVMNLMKYSQSYNAACRLMTTMDEVLDRLINNTGVCGR